MLLRTVSTSLSRFTTWIESGSRASIRPLSSELGEHGAFLTDVNNTPIHCLRVGNGPHNILLLSGALGTATTDFMPQLTGLDRNLFTIYAWDPPGYGKSIPPKRTWTSDSIFQDATVAAGLLKVLGLKETSVIGYSYGGTIALVLATLYPSIVNRLVLSGARAYITKADVEVQATCRCVADWDARQVEILEEEFGEELQEVWSAYLDATASLLTGDCDGNIIGDRIHEIKNPALIFYGEKDPFILPEHPYFLLSQIRNAQLISLPNASHRLNVTHAEDFNKLVTCFLTN